MKIKFLIIFVLCFVFDFSFSQNISEKAEISIITCAPGEPLYTAFGHSAVRVKDAKYKIDKVYNYGTFNFNTPNFYLKFASGKLDYMLSVAPFKYFIYSYVKRNRMVKEQILDLSYEQKQKIFYSLQNNSKPENMYYRYDFFFDNCATRIKDVFKNSLKDDLIFAEIDTSLTFRDAISSYLKNRNWGRFGINLALGLPIDRKMQNEEITFLPDYLMLLFENSEIITNGKKHRIVKETRTIFRPKKIKEFHAYFITPDIIIWFWFVVGIILTGFEFWRKKYFIWFDNLLFFVILILSLIVLSLWFFTEHQTVVNNLNIFWLFPLHFPALFFLSKKKYINFIKKYFLVSFFIIILIIIFDKFIPQKFDILAVPFSFLIAIRSGAVFFRKFY